MSGRESGLDPELVQAINDRSFKQFKGFEGSVPYFEPLIGIQSIDLNASFNLRRFTAPSTVSAVTVTHFARPPRKEHNER